MKNIHYVAAFFFAGQREDLKRESRDFFFKHIEVLKKENITQIAFVVNSNSPSEDEPILLEAVKELSGQMQIMLLVRQNRGYSYGAWEYALDHIGVDYDCDFFLIEGDYVPNPGFLKAFTDEMKPETGFVAQKIDSIPGSAPEHASISNGLLSGRWAKEAETKFGRIFAIYPFTLTRGDHLMGCENQVTFLQFILESGAKLAGIAPEYSIPFFETTLNKTFEHGTKGAFAPLQPIQGI